MGNTKPIGVAYSDQDLTGSTLTDVTIIGPTFTPPLVLSGATSQALLRITQTGAGNALVVEDAANPDSTPFVVDANGVVGIGETTPSSFASAGMVLRSSAASTPAIFNWNTTNDASTSSFGFRKDRAGAVVQSGDLLGLLRWQGFDSGSYRTAAQVTGEVDGTPGTNDMPGRLVFSTTADGAAGPVERMRLNANGNVGIGTTAPVNRLQVNGSFGRGAPVTKTGNFTLADTENWLICNGAGSITMTFPAASAWTGREVMIKTIAAQTVVSASADVVPLAGGAAGTAILAATAGAWATLVSDGTNWVIMQA